MKNIDAKQLNQILDRDDDWLLVDTLPNDSYEKQHIPGARNVPAKDESFVSRVEDLVGAKDDPVIVYCANHECGLSPDAAKKLEEAGFTNVMDFEGGIDEWKKAGFDVTTDEAADARR